MPDAADTTPASRAPSARQKLVALFFAAFLLVQLAVPAYMLTQPRPARFGWQMYSGVRIAGVYLVEDATGRLDTVRVADYVARSRIEVDHRGALPAFLCQAVEGAAAVVHERAGEPPERHPCP
jgi:hypothetical protein